MTPPTADRPPPGEPTPGRDPGAERGAAGDDHATAREVALAAGALLLEMRSRCFGPFGGEEADRAAHELIVAELGHRRPGDAVLSEEGHDDRSRLRARRLWIVDPLDGTNEYTVRRRQDWAVHVCLAVDGETVAGAVALPDLGECHVTGPAATLVPPRDPAAPVRVALSRTRSHSRAGTIARRLGAEVVRIGSAGAKAAAVLRGDVDAYLHAGGMWEWDAAAPVAVAQASGLHASRLDGRPFRFNQDRPFVPDLLICRPELVDAVLAAAAGRGS